MTHPLFCSSFPKTLYMHVVYYVEIQSNSLISHYLALGDSELKIGKNLYLDTSNFQVLRTCLCSTFVSIFDWLTCRCSHRTCPETMAYPQHASFQEKYFEVVFSLVVARNLHFFI